MKIITKSIAVVIMTGLLLGCEKQWDDPIPEGSELGVPRLIADLNEDGRVLLEWHSSSDCIGRGIWGECVPKVEGSHYEIFVKFPGENEFVKLERVGKGVNGYLVSNVELGKPYEFHITSHRAGQVTTSNNVMIVPNSFPKYEVLMEAESGRTIRFPTVNIQGDKVAYISNYMWNEDGRDYMEFTLFLRDLAKSQSELIQKGTTHPRWSVDGSKLVFGSTKGLNQVPWSYTPIHLKAYDLNSKEIELLNRGMHQHLFPNFSKDNQSILFLSDSLERGRMGIWKLGGEGKTEVLWPNLELPANAFGSPLHTGFDASVLSDWVAIDNLRVVGDRAIYDIQGLELTDGIQKKGIMVTEWNDMTPSFSPFDKNLLAFISDRSGRRQVWTVHLSTGELKQASFFTHDFYLNFEGISLSWIDQGNGITVPASGIDGIKLVKVPVPN